MGRKIAMLRLNLVVVAFLGVCALAEHMHPRIANSGQVEMWRQWKSTHNKNYAGVIEEVMRFEVWEENARKVMHHNLRESLGLETFKTGMNAFADMTSEEFISTHLGRVEKLRSPRKTEEHNVVSSVPSTQDWRPKGYVTPVKDQGQCGSCWSFAATGGLEGQHFAAKGKLVSLSEQQQVDCNNRCYGCNGGNADQAFKYWIKDNGANSEASYPYTGKDQKCKTSGKKVVATMSSYKDLPYGNEGSLKDASGTVGPISVAIDASHWSFQMYTSGVYYEKNCSSRNLDHAVLVVGYNSDGGDKYWIVKNSWGTSWGQDGYIWMSRDRNNNCGIASDASYPIV